MTALAHQSMLTYKLPLSLCLSVSSQEGCCHPGLLRYSLYTTCGECLPVCSGWEGVWWFPEPGADPPLTLAALG